jgi:hypothetical protein
MATPLLFATTKLSLAHAQGHDEIVRIQESRRIAPSLSNTVDAMGGMRRLGTKVCIRYEIIDLAGSPGASSLTSGMPRSVRRGGSLQMCAASSAVVNRKSMMTFGSATPDGRWQLPQLA